MQLLMSLRRSAWDCKHLTEDGLSLKPLIVEYKYKKSRRSHEGRFDPMGA